jgi:hypothetical protein
VSWNAFDLSMEMVSLLLSSKLVHLDVSRLSMSPTIAIPLLKKIKEHKTDNPLINCFDESIMLTVSSSSEFETFDFMAQ